MDTDAVNTPRIDVSRALGGWRSEPASAESPHRSARDMGAVCSHCANPVPAGLIDPQSPQRFCCNGCRTAYAVIHSCGLDRYYRLREELESSTAAVRASGRSFAEFDEPVFRTLYCQRVLEHSTGRERSSGSSPAPYAAGGESVLSVELVLEGVHCSACVWLLEKLPRLIPGVIEARLDLRRATVRVTWNDEAVRLSRIASALDSLGYRPHPARDARARSIRRSEDRRFLIRLAVAGACAANVMLLALCLYAGLFDWIDPTHVRLFRWVSMAVTVVSLAWPGRVFFTSAWAAVRTRTPHLDVPIALALLAGGAWSVVSTIRGVGEVYFDTVSVLVFLLLVGRFIQHRQQRWAADAVELLFSITPSSARRVSRSPGGEEVIEDVPVEALRLGDVVELRAGESFPADGTVIRGDSLVDQSMLTGESAHVPISVGDPAAAGAVNIASTLRVTVEATGENTRVGRLMRLVEESSRRKAPIVRFADRVSSFFTVAMLGLAAATFVVWLSIDAPHAIEHAVALLVVTCPCALGLATPLVITIAMGRAARSGILLKGGDAMQRLSRPGRIFLDKTGTLTFGAFTLVRWIGDESVKPMVAAVESESDHPIARALARELGRGDDPLPVAIDVEQLQGVGIRGVVGDRDVRVLSPAAVRAARASDPDGLLDHEASLAAEALTPVVVVIDGRVGAIAGLGDRVRPDATAAVASLRRLGWEVSILSGDHQRVVDAVARRVGIEPDRAIGRASPEEKLEVIRRESGRGPTVMVGDGVNDSAALAAAGVGIAVHGGAEASLSAADVYLNSPGLSSIVELVESSRRTMRVIHRNLGVSVLYNATAGALAMTGHMNPLIAALVMPLSSLTVLALACRSRTFGGVS